MFLSNSDSRNRRYDIASSSEHKMDVMIDQFTIVAANLAALRVEASKLNEPDDRQLFADVIAHLEGVLVELSELPGTLSGEMPWWQTWDGRLNRSPPN